MVSFIYRLLLLNTVAAVVLGFGVHPNPSAKKWRKSPTRTHSTASAAAPEDGDDPSSIIHQDNSNNNTATTVPFITTFDDLGLSPRILSSVRSQRAQWETPTDIQRLAIPELIQRPGTSFWCQAPTGEGKTLAFGLPLLHHLVTTKQQKQKQHQNTAKIRSLILCPTRELAIQIQNVLQNLANNIAGSDKMTIVAIYGGVRREEQIEQLASCVRNHIDIDCCVATPGRLVDVVLQYYNSTTTIDNDAKNAKEAALERRLLNAMEQESTSSLSLHTIQKLQLDRDDDDGRGQLSSLLDSLEYLVVDEADRLLGRSFEREMDPVLDLVQQVPAWLFSATFPLHIEPRVNTVLRRLAGNNSSSGENYEAVRISSTNADRLATEGIDSARLSKKLERTTAIVKEKIDSVGPASTIDLRLIRLEKRDRTQALLRLLVTHRSTWDRVLVFVGTRYASEHVARKLRRVGVKCAEFHGKLDQDARSRRLNDLATGKIRVLIATDIGSRGLDIAGLPAVVNYDLPRSTADFVHRVGRTGRAGQQGTAVTFVTGDTEAHWELIESRHLPEPVERELLEGFEVNEERWSVESEGSRLIAPGAAPSTKGLAHDRMFGGVKGRRKSKKDRLREQAAQQVSSSGGV